MLLKRSAEFEQFTRATIENLPKVYKEIEEDVKLRAEDIIAAVQDQVVVKWEPQKDLFFFFKLNNEFSETPFLKKFQD